MIDLLAQSILASILTADNTATLVLLQDHQTMFVDPIEGVALHAKILYYAIKNANQDIIRYLLNLPVLSDIPFFRFCGHTPISLAVEEGHAELLPLLLAKTDKNFALHMAVKLNLPKTKSFLLSKCVFKEKLLQFLGCSK